jgi:hypothetical protein
LVLKAVRIDDLAAVVRHIKAQSTNSSRCSQHILDRVGDARQVARIVDQSGKRSGHHPAALGKRKQDHAAVRGKTAAIEWGYDFLARHC